LKRIAFVIAIAFLTSLASAYCAGTAELEFDGNRSVGHGWSSAITPEGIVREASNKYRVLLPFPGMGGKFVFKFQALAEGEAEILLTHYFRGTPWEVIIYKAVVDKRKNLTLEKNLYDITMVSVENAATRLGIEPFDLSNYEEAITGLTEIISKNPDHADAYYTRGLAYFTALAYFTEEKYGEAKKNFETALRIDPEHIKAEFYLDIVTRFHGSE
jgi:tetratricopeptide (TPR) repeat protein